MARTISPVRVAFKPSIAALLPFLAAQHPLSNQDINNVLENLPAPPEQ